ncbi:MAG: hypothetical protein ABIQ75_07830 [Flavobacteriales bacterium]
MDWFHFSFLLNVVSPAFALLCCLRIRRPRHAFFTALLPLLWVDLLAEVYGTHTALQGLRNTTFYNGVSVLEFLLILRLLATHRRGSRWSFTITAFAGLLGWYWSWTRWRSLDFLLTEGISIAGLLITLWALVLLWWLSEESSTPLAKVPQFWVLTALLVFYGSLFPIIGPLRMLYEDSPQLANYLYNIVNVLSCVSYGLIGYGCILEERAQRRPLKG